MISIMSFSTILLGVLALLSSFCGIQSNIEPRDTNSIRLMKPETLVEIRIEKTGMVDSSGELSGFLMYSDGKAEFQYHSLQIDNDKAHGYVKKEIFLDATDFREIKALIIMNDYLASKSSYENKKELSDALTITKITSFHDHTEKTITLSETDSRINLENKEDIYPSSLIKLLKLVESLGNRYHEGS